MPKFKVGKSVVSTSPTVDVENRLRRGRYRFRLVVVDEHGIASNPAEIQVQVRSPNVERREDER